MEPIRRREALSHGLSPWAIRSPEVTKPHHGVVADATDDRDDGLIRGRHALPVMTETSVLTGWAGARWQGVTMLDGRGRGGQVHDVLIASPAGGQHRHPRGVRGTRRRILPDEQLDFEDVRVASLAGSVFDEALAAATLEETVVVLDMGLSRVVGQARTTAGNLERLVARHPKVRGTVRVRQALELVSDRSASPWETRPGMLACRADITGLLVNVPVFSLDGALLGIADSSIRSPGWSWSPTAGTTVSSWRTLVTTAGRRS